MHQQRLQWRNALQQLVVRAVVLVRDRQRVGQAVGGAAHNLVGAHRRIVGIDGAHHAHGLLVERGQLAQERDAHAQRIQAREAAG
jgi:hypothetical protein